MKASKFYRQSHQILGLLKKPFYRVLEILEHQFSFEAFSYNRKNIFISN